MNKQRVTEEKRDGMNFFRGLLNAVGLELIVMAAVLLGWMVMR